MVVLPYIHMQLNRRRKAWELITKLETMDTVITLMRFVAFFWGGQ